MTLQEKINLMSVVAATTNNVMACTRILVNLKRLSEFAEDERSTAVIKELEKISEEIVENSNFIVAVCTTMAIDGKSDLESIKKTLAEIKEDTKV